MELCQKYCLNCFLGLNVKVRVLGTITTNTLYVLYLTFGMVMLPVSAWNSIKIEIFDNFDKTQAISLRIKWGGSKIV